MAENKFKKGFCNYFNSTSFGKKIAEFVHIVIALSILGIIIYFIFNWSIDYILIDSGEALRWAR